MLKNNNCKKDWCGILLYWMQGEGYLVAKVFSTSDCEGEELLRTHLLHHAHLSLHVEGLRTGYSKDVHGEVGGAHLLAWSCGWAH